MREWSPRNDKKLLRMNTLTMSDFKKNISTSLNRVDAGEFVCFRRGNQLYAVVPVSAENAISPQLEKVIDQGRQDYEAGRCVECNGHEELAAFLDSL